MYLLVGPGVGDLIILGALSALPCWYGALGWWLCTRLWPRAPRVTSSPRATYGGPGLQSWGAGTTSS